MNKGLFHGILNSQGTAKASDDKFWYDTSVVIESIADCFNPDNLLGGNIASGKSGRPDGKYYDVVYENQVLDCRYSSTKTNLHDTASKVFSDGVSGKGGVCDTVGMISKTAAKYYNYNNNNKLGISFDGYAQSKFEKYRGVTVTVFTVDGLNIAKGILFPEFSAGNYSLYNIKIIKGFSTTNSWTDTANIVIRKDLPIIQVGEQLVTDLIGSPENYSTIMKDMLARGETIIGLNPLLISDTGDNLIPDGTKNVWKFSNKLVKSLNARIMTLDGGTTYNKYADIVDSTENRSVTVKYIIGTVMFIPYTASIPVAAIQDPKQVDYVLEKYCASNSHSIYKGNNITGLIGVGTGNDMESGYLGDCELVAIYDHILTTENINISTDTLVEINEIVYVPDDSLSTHPYNPAVSGGLYRKLVNTGELLGGSAFTFDERWESLGVQNIPSNQTISLSNIGDKASKAFLTIASDDNNELYAQWIVEELASGWDGTSTFEDDTTTGLTIDKVYQEQTSKLLYRALADKITVSDTATWSNPFDGDSGEFEQLANGVTTDVNGNAIRTVCASTPLNLLKDV